MSRLLFGVFLLIVCCVGQGWCQLPDWQLYSDEDFQYSGTGAIGSSRSQRFNPTTATPNPTSNQFVEAGMYLQMGAAGESANVTIRLFNWVTDFNTTVAGTPIAGPATFDVSTTPVWYKVTSAGPLAANGDYLLQCSINSMTFVSTGFGVRRSNSNDGGTGNDAYNGSTVQTNREYQVGLWFPPSVESWELY